MSPRKGALLAIPLDRGRYCLAQLVGHYERQAPIVVVYEGIYPSAKIPEMPNVSSLTMRLIAYTLDAKIRSGDWDLIGESKVPLSVLLPAFKEMKSPPDTYEVVDALGLRRRPATDLEALRLPFRKIVSPKSLEKAVRAANGLEVWQPSYDALLPPREGNREADLFVG